MKKKPSYIYVNNIRIKIGGEHMLKKERCKFKPVFKEKPLIPKREIKPVALIMKEKKRRY